MTPSEYQQESILTSKRAYGMPTIAYFTLGLAGETGEFLEKVANSAVGNEATILELGDVTWYFSGILYEMHVDFGMLSYDEKQFKNETALGQSIKLSYEVGRLTEQIKKLFRDGKGELSFDRQKAIEQQMSLILGLLHAIARSLGVDLETVMIRNRQKLLDRVARGVRGGEGDNR